MYADYMSNQPMRDGMEIRSFFDEVNEENQSEEKADCRIVAVGAPWTPILKKRRGYTLIAKVKKTERRTK